ncbi:MAG: gliding motility-associated ABC transporter substrate-binding protein GldG [Bacteroidetes bacterium]|uniref:Gliding motility-associated ABC transporter substrate-binding protein GldG n=1 Tax=Candidatus Gallipaludibacter merdavium TaxID=2840839 RepID=A0A9D9N4P3_9BACT|nr:gliding motility-associated ABC transporter substrate-binding protein GldG [Candidatus Gallipaludibacter merdavium]
MKFLKKYSLLIGCLIVVLLNILSANLFFRIDLTSDKRHSVSQPTKQLMAGLNQEVDVTIYLDGEMNSGFLRLKRSVAELLDELSIYAPEGINYSFTNPTSLPQEEQKRLMQLFAENGISPTTIYERNRDGKSVQRLLFPWLRISYGDKQQWVSLLKNIKGNSGEENLNISIESLEFQLTDAIRLLTQKEIQKIAFIEGHGELSDYNTWDISLALSRYFQIDRGVLGTDASVLDDYKAIIIAAPIQPFSENDKYIIDQYIMRGGRVLWLIDGVRLDENSLSTTGMSPTIPMDVNLTDMLFRYGVRVNPMIVQDQQCLLVPVNVASEGEPAHFEPMPWYFAPLLLTSPNHPVSRNLPQVTGTFVSCLDMVGENENLRRDVLLATSNATHIISAPAAINVEEIELTPDYFNLAYVPVAVALDGVFPSLFAHRLMPQNITNAPAKLKESVPTKQIVMASGSFISNDIQDGQPLPVGYDRYTQTQFGNRDFFINALLYLTDDQGWINLRNKQLKIRLINKNIATNMRLPLQLINVGLPLLFLAIFGVVFFVIRRRVYTHR